MYTNYIVIVIIKFSNNSHSVLYISKISVSIVKLFRITIIIESKCIQRYDKLEELVVVKALESKEQFYEKINNERVMMLFTADWCPDCRVIEHFLPELEQKYSEYQFISVDRDDFIDLCQEYDVFGIPSFLAFNKGKELGSFVSKNRKTKEQIESFIDDLANK